ncbi:hypothetical protein ACGFNU_14715 [Spirillospora sp. NPDC048911]|uniref:hypothetical protein n=1 Tax=Spirillospora sp. NPDC048911 TaxID=3364527 RepID=UPI0037149F32
MHLNAAATWLRQLAIAAERPGVPVELGDNVCARPALFGDELARLSNDVAETDQIITDDRPLKPFLSMHNREPWGSRAYGEDPATWGKRLSTVLSMRQILMLAREDEEPWRNNEPGISYLDGIKDLPGIDDWVSKRAADRLARARHAAIQSPGQAGAVHHLQRRGRHALPHQERPRRRDLPQAAAEGRDR